MQRGQGGNSMHGKGEVSEQSEVKLGRRTWHDVVELGEGSFFGEYQVLNGVKSCWTVKAT